MLAESDGYNKISLISKEQMAQVEETVQRKTYKKGREVGTNIPWHKVWVQVRHMENGQG